MHPRKRPPRRPAEPPAENLPDQEFSQGEVEGLELTMETLAAAAMPRFTLSSLLGREKPDLSISEEFMNALLDI